MGTREGALQSDGGEARALKSWVTVYARRNVEVEGNQRKRSKPLSPSTAKLVEQLPLHNDYIVASIFSPLIQYCRDKI